MQKMTSSSGNEKKPKKLKLSQDSGELDGFEILRMFQEEREACAKSISHFKFNKKRVKLLSKATDIPEGSKGVLYWMSRDQRVQDNWALLYAQHLALKVELPLYVCFCLVPKFLDATIRQYRFMLKGLKEVAEECRSLNIGFTILCGEAKHVLPDFIKQHEIGGVVTDFSPLRVPMAWVKDVKDLLPDSVPFCQVDAHNVVPCWSASDKLEYGARTIRPKIHNKLQEFLTQFPVVVKHKFSPQWKTKPIGTDADWVCLENSLEVNREVSDVDWAIPGSKAGLLKLSEFCNERLKYFHEQRNDPTKEALSDLSPWFHFGQLSVQRSILTVSKYKSKYCNSVEAYIEEAVVRRELAENFCYYNSKYDSIEGAYSWAKQTLSEHTKDKREYLYSLEQLEHACTHDPLWNAAQTQMIVRGKMHGFLRMYWAKKILEWTDSPENALRIAIYLNDKYELDGRDPNGYVGCMWSICGVHDQGWKERTVFGKIRFMNFNGCQRKFDVNKFIRMYKK